MEDQIRVRGARQHNLKNVNLDIPKGKLVVFTGVSGSGKSSLALDTIYAEGQRRYVESLSSYARQFLGIMEKPDVDSIEGLSPAIAIDQKSTSHNPRSTIGTVTEIYDYLRLLFARVGHPHCPNCGMEIQLMSAEEISNQISELSKGHGKKGLRVLILAPVVKDRKGEFSKLFENLKKQGYFRVRIDKVFHNLKEDITLIKTNRHTVEVIVDRLVLTDKPLGFAIANPKGLLMRLTQSVENGLRLSNGSLIAAVVNDRSFEIPEAPKLLQEHLFSERFSCPKCNISLPEIEPRSFSFNSPHGACPNCSGLGSLLKVDDRRVLNLNLSIDEGGILPWGNLVTRESWFLRLLAVVGKQKGFSLATPLGELPKQTLRLLLYGTGDELYTVSGANRFGQQRSFEERFEGVIPNLERRYRETESDYVREEIEKYMFRDPCPVCHGTRLKKESLAVTVSNQNIAEISAYSIASLRNFLQSLIPDLNNRERIIIQPIIKEILNRLKFLNDVGLDYLTIDRAATTLAGGEAQRIRLASQIGSGLSGVLYVLDEPSIGLHQRDQGKLINTLKELRDLGNTVIVVEHDPQTILSADYVFDFGPGAGDHGGLIIAKGTPEEILKNNNSLTGQYLSGKRRIALSPMEFTPLGLEGLNPKGVNSTPRTLTITGCREHNLKDIDVSIPLGKFVCVTGVSGSGKSTLINETLYRALRQELGMHSEDKPGVYETLSGLDYVDKVIFIDQSPIGKTPRSNPATYTKAFDGIRQLFTGTKEAKLRGFKEGRFSFNVAGGRCEACQGEGQIRIEMQFLPDVYVPCEVCHGRRYNTETLEVEYRGKNIADVLEMTVEEALIFFDPVPFIADKLRTLDEVGLKYLKLGQPAPTLSGGESQRVKLSRELSKRSTGKTIYLLDEPTTGLHFADLEKLLNVLKRLVAKGNTVLVIEHNLEVIASADWVIDLGPEGGNEGGSVIFSGSPQQLMKNQKSYTGKALAGEFGKN